MKLLYKTGFNQFKLVDIKNKNNVLGKIKNDTDFYSIGNLSNLNSLAKFYNFYFYRMYQNLNSRTHYPLIKDDPGRAPISVTPHYMPQGQGSK